MKRELKRLSLITLVLAVLTVGFILLRDGSLALYMANPTPLSADDVTVECDEAVARTVSVKAIPGNGICIRMKRTGNGSSELKIGFPDRTVRILLSSGPFGVLINESNNDFTGWAFLLLTGTLWFLAAFLLFFTGYRKERRENLFAYRTVNKLGLSLLFGLLTFQGTVLLVIRGIDPCSFKFYTVLSALSLAMVYFAVFTAPVVLVFAVLLCVSNISLIRHERFRPVNLLGVALSLLMILGLAGGFQLDRLLLSLPKSSNFWNTTFMNTYYGFYAFFVCMLFAVFILFGYIRKHEPAYDKDFIVILGCRIRPDGTLYPLIRGRVDKAIEFAKKQEAAGGPRAYFIPSGGKGDNEPVSEAEAMAAYLKAQGVEEDRILVEDKARTTRENLRFSRAIAEAKKPGAAAAFSTTNYHVFRSGILAAKEGWKLEGMGAVTKWYFWPNAQIREFAGLLNENKKGIAVFFLVIILQSAAVALLL